MDAVSTMTWGRRPGAPGSNARAVALVVGIALLIGVASFTDGPVHRSIITFETSGDVQALLDQHVRTLEEANEFHHMRTYDRQSAAQTKCAAEWFRLGAERAAELRPGRLIRLEETTRASTLIRAFVQRRDGVAVLYFRRVLLVNILTLPPFDIRRVTPVWYLGSPNDTELAKVFVTQAGTARLESRGIDEAARRTIEREVDDLAREFISPPIEAPGATPRPPLRLRLLPAPEFGPNGCVNGATYDRSAGEVLLYPIWADDRYSSLSDRTRSELRSALREQSRNP